MSPLRVLVVEDNDLNRLLMGDLLRLRGHEVLDATGVQDGLEALRRDPPDLVVLDLRIPGGGGERLLAEIRSDARTAALPVVAVTAFAMQGDRERFLAAGFDAYLSKPIDTRSFVPALEGIVSERRNSDGS